MPLKHPCMQSFCLSSFVPNGVRRGEKVARKFVLRRGFAAGSAMRRDGDFGLRGESRRNLVAADLETS